MPINYKLKFPLLRWVTVGEVEYESGIQVTLSSLDECRKSAKRGGHILADLRRSTENRNSEEIKGIAAIIKQNKEFLSKKLAIIVEDILVYGNSRAFQAFMDNFGVEVHIFSEEEGVIQWLKPKG